MLVLVSVFAFVPGSGSPGPSASLLSLLCPLAALVEGVKAGLVHWPLHRPLLRMSFLSPLQMHLPLRSDPGIAIVIPFPHLGVISTSLELLTRASPTAVKNRT